MKNTAFLTSILFCFTLLICFSCDQPKDSGNLEHKGDPAIIDSNYIASKTTYFTNKNDSIYGEGLETLKQIFQESQFVVFGERHNSQATSNLITALIPIMNDNSFNTLCLEVGPHSATKLKELMDPPHKTIENLKNFNTTYYNKEVDNTSIPFFSGVEDAKFLEEASKFNMDIWGLDQEYYYSILFLTDQLLSYTKGDQHSPQLQELKQKADKVILEWFIKENNSEEEIDIFKEMLNEADVQNFFNAISNASPEASKIIEDIKISWDIYSRWRDDSHADRISYMRNNFSAHYEAEIDKNKSAPKVFLKFGQVHASQILSLGTYDLGHFLNEKAKDENVNCTNINSWKRYNIEDGKEIDYLTEYPKFYKRYKPFISLGTRDKWTIINLKSIRDDLSNNIVKLPNNGDFHKLNALIQGYDYQFIIPLDQNITSNIEQED